MLPSVRRTLKVSNDYAADINKLSYFLLMPAQQKGKCTERTARLYLTLTLGIINGMQSICEECFICRIFVYLLCLVFIYTALLVACPACGTEVKIQGLALQSNLLETGSQMKAAWSNVQLKSWLSRKPRESEAPMCEPKWTQVGFQSVFVQN